METLSFEKVERLRVQASEAMEQQRYGDAITHLNAAIWLRQEDPELHEMRGESYSALCDVHSAVLNFRRALKLSNQEDAAMQVDQSEETARRSDALARMLDLRAITMLDEGSFSQALPLLSEAVALSPDDPGFLLHRALAYSCLEKYAEALQDLDACATNSPPGADVHFLRAKLHLLRKELPAARSAVDDALELEPQHAASKVPPPDATRGRPLTTHAALRVHANAWQELLQTMADCSAVYAEEATKLMLLGQAEDAATNLTHAMQVRPPLARVTRQPRCACMAHPIPTDRIRVVAVLLSRDAAAAAARRRAQDTAGRGSAAAGQAAGGDPRPRAGHFGRW